MRRRLAAYDTLMLNSSQVLLRWRKSVSLGHFQNRNRLKMDNFRQHGVEDGHKKVETAWPGLSMEQLIEELRQIQQFTLLYPPQGEKGPNRVATVLSKHTLAQQSLADVLGLEQLRRTQRG